MATPESLLSIFERNDLDSLVEKLQTGKTTFEEFQARTKEDWERIVGLAPGVDIYNHLHPRQAGIVY